jgi:hypothetical protein
MQRSLVNVVNRPSSDASQPDASKSKQIKDNFVMPRMPYRGDFTPGHLVFNSNLQEFAHRVSLICGLETGGKISGDQAYEDIKKLWQELKASKKNLLEYDQTPDDPANGSEPPS